jgi:hypothetical protein
MLLHDAFGLVSQMVVPTNGAVPFVTHGAAACVHPNGVFVTATHVIENLFRTHSPYDLKEAARLARVHGTVPVEDHERPYLLLPWAPRHRGSTPTPRSGFLLHALAVHRFHGDVATDAAAICVSPGEDFRPFPFLRPRIRPITVGGRVRYLGHSHQYPFTPFKDDLGYPSAFAIYYGEATVVALTQGGFLLDAEAKLGMSGGPVVDYSSGELMGVITEVWSASFAQQSVGINRSLTLVADIESCRPQVGLVLHDEGWLS